MIEEFEYNSKAMGTDCFISIICNSKEISDKIYKIAIDEITRYEFIFSRFLPTSELCILNKNKRMKVSKDFLEVTQKAYKLFIETDGVFNPLVQISRFGYNQDFNKINSDDYSNESIFSDVDYNIDFSSVIIDELNSIIILNKGQKLDYGGFIKGYVSEMITKKIKSYSKNIFGVIVNIGGDIYTEGLDKNGNKFIFNIYNPVMKNNDVVVELYNQALATSGVYKRTWTRFGNKMHHILDVTGKQNPDSDIVSSSVICNDGAMAEAYAKVFLSMNYKNTLELLNNKILFVLIKNDGQIIKNII